MKVNFIKVKLKVMEYIHKLMALSIKDIEKMINTMVEVKKNKLTVVFIKVNLVMGIDKVKEN